MGGVDGGSGQPYVLYDTMSENSLVPHVFLALTLNL